jgi:hypothetical protein
MEYLLANQSSKQIINECYEGTYLSIFYHDKWYVSTRRCLNSSDSVFSENMSHFQMLEDVLTAAGYESFDKFTEVLNKEYSFYFVLIHHKNKHTIDYSSVFGNEYKKLCLTTVRDSEMRELETFDFPTNDYIFIPKNLESINEFAEMNKIVKYDQVPSTEGIVIRVFDSNRQLNRLIKLQSMAYQFAMVLGTERNIFKGLLYLYQNDKLVDYFVQNPNIQNIKKIVNPLNTSESYDTVGMVDSVFKVCTSELFELFKVLWSLKDCKNQNKVLYAMLPKEYKDIMFAVRGLYYKKKATLFNSNGTKVENADVKNSHLKISDIYSYLKTLSTDNIVAFLRMRKLMFNWVKTNSDNKALIDFGTVSKYCDKVHLKLSAIFTNKLFPNIMPNDVPPMPSVKAVEETA